MKDIRNKTALITGGARGMGKLWAERLLADGARVILLDIDAAALKIAKSELEKSYRGRIASYAVDITNRAALYKTMKKASNDFGAIEILINNAGIVAGGKFLEVTDEKHAATIDINLKAMIFTIKAVLPGMIQKKSGHIVNISSAAGFLGTPFMAPYNASKWGVIGLTESLKLELEETGIHNIRFTLVCPSYVDTGMFAGVKAPLFTPILSPDQIVDIAYRSFRKDKYFVLEPFIVKFVPFLRGILPNRAFGYVAKILGVTSSMSGWHGKRR
jgi:all-trans-retinol dehydrogenase (NAD+)